ncbi:hypothetical protein CI109_105952 [Kwoniella shandongensis]|uniref:Uncharacterized protein n=1 Tax=Kwoniella shandongensis TaxID=1734106 RepID=A0A5M6BZC4_9TREE|nr:uncharacterized protein CI109_004000 [Kwoniella shandongensis]KAA5527741.1 hypothetical protein CI109_004000 [Kwoniella shandongensis]
MRSSSRATSFADLADLLGFGSSKPLSRSRNPIARPRSTLELHHTAETRRRRQTSHLPTSIIIRILSFADPSTLAHCLTVSRLFFHLAGTILYSSLTLCSTDFRPVLSGSAVVHEAVTGKVAVGRKKFKDRLLKLTQEVTLLSHGDDDDDESDDERGRGKEIWECPPLSLSALTPKMKTLRIVLADEFDYHLTFCPRYPHHCPLLLDLDYRIDRMIILGARSPLVVLPTAFPNYTSSPTTSLSLPISPTHTTTFSRTSTRSTPPPSTIIDGDSTLTLTLDDVDNRGGGREGHGRHSASGHHGNGTFGGRSALPKGILDLYVVLPTGQSYDAKDYQDHHHAFHKYKTLSDLQRLTIVFSTPTPYKPWQIAYYDSRQDPTWTSYLNLAEDIAETCLSVPGETEVRVVGVENMDGELLNMGVGVMQQGKERVGKIMEERVRRRMEVRLRAKGREEEVGKRAERVRFVRLQEWMEEEGTEVLGENADLSRGW